MFGQRALQVKMVKAQDETPIENNNPPIKNWNDIADAAAKFMRDGAIVIGGVYIATRAFNTACNITELTIKSKLK
jgi:hypothetical protein